MEKIYRDLIPLFLDSFMKGEYVAIRQLSEEKKEEKVVVQTTVKSLSQQILFILRVRYILQYLPSQRFNCSST